MSANPATREAWLSFYLSELQRGFNIQTPETVHITCGWSSKGQKASKKGWTVELIHKDYSKSGAYEFFISPECTTAEEFKDQLTYYLVRIFYNEFGKKRKYTNQWMRSVSWGSEDASTIYEKITTDAETHTFNALGAYPHQKIVLPDNDATHRKNPLLKLLCHDCGSICRMTKLHITMGTPFCQCGGRYVEV